MKRVVAYDDLSLSRDGVTIEAEHVSVPLMLGTERVDLDLTDVHLKELRELIQPYLDAGSAAPPPRKAAPPAPARQGQQRPQGGSGRSPTAYNQGMIAYANARGIEVRKNGGKPYYTAALRAEYAQYLADGGEVLA
jgi:hypothetical protein